ncbi:flagellar biosynthetic protein FliR [Amylibacter sp. SFDW26]|uniref:flagellar biosynthetic protein FliR n=1 Tax=Amylibacter sp. SFDW26 TaxID=2652722 RepID=UPI00126154BF|nr:flagellar biosynthetic protein FliR [Amylibacter sp. SFDW26]KAB7613601.1 flagellar biosynthetic protein FliR [Amylibacter sp. SFDW26]
MSLGNWGSETVGKEIAFHLLDVPFEIIHIVFVLSVLRAFGLTFSFLAFGWGLGSGLTLRISICLVVSLPVMLVNFNQIVEISKTLGPLEITLLAAKEFAVGFGMGLLASSPFRALQYAGSIVDSFRGESDSGLQMPDGTPVQTLAMLYLIIGFSVFFAMGGLWKLVENLYVSYEIWPLKNTLPTLYHGSAQIALEALSKAMELALIIVAPLMIMLVAVEIVLMVSAKLGKKFNFYEHSFLTKNIITMLTLPIMAIIILRVSEKYVPNAILSLSVMETYFK